MNEREYIYDPEEKTMVFTTEGTRRHVRAVYHDGRVWYVASDIAKLLGYRDPSKAINSLECEIKILHVPHVSQSKRGTTTCNCITKETVKQFINQQRAYPEVRNWIGEVVVPQAERQLAEIVPAEAAPRQSLPVRNPTAPLLDALDQFIIAAVSLRREIQAQK